MYLILSTFVHLAALAVPQYCHNPLHETYRWIILLSTLASAAWHLTNESNRTLYILDYGLAGLWVIWDIALGLQTMQTVSFIQILYLNAGIFALHQIQARMIKDRQNYIYYHSLWHLMSAGKAVAVALLVQCSCYDDLLQCPASQWGQKVGYLPYSIIQLHKHNVCQI
jgi:hypothetical protein